MNQTWKKSNEPILIRCSGLGAIATEPREKSNAEKYQEAVESLNKYENDYSLIVNKTTAAAKKKLEQIQKTNTTILTLAKIKDDINLSETCKSYLIKAFVQHEFDRYDQISSKYLEKGTLQEEDAITLLSRLTKTIFTKNTERLKDAFKTGECDLYTGKSVKRAEHTFDTKCSWSAVTFYEAISKDLNKDYQWQGDGYMDLYNADQHSIAYCLVNGTAKHIMDEKRRLAYQMDIIDDSTQDPEYVKRCQQIERNHIFDIKLFIKHNPWFEFHSEIKPVIDGLDSDEPLWEYDIPMEKRLHIKTFERDQARIDFIHNRILECRDYINKTFYK